MNTDVNIDKETKLNYILSVKKEHFKYKDTYRLKVNMEEDKIC